MKRTRPTQSAIAQELRSELQGKIFWRGYRSGNWYYWQATETVSAYCVQPPQWKTLPPSELQRKIQSHLDDHPDFQDGYTAAFVVAIERLLRGYLAFNSGDFYQKDRQNPNLLAGVQSVARTARPTDRRESR